jgi:heptosyltransferase III
MIRFKPWDILRKSIVRFLTKGHHNTPNFIDAPVTRILVVRPNHRLGNQLLLTPLLQEIEKIYPAAKVSILVKGNAAPVIFKSYKFERVFQLPRRPLREPIRYLLILFRMLMVTYDIAFNAVPGSSSGRLFTTWANARVKFIGDKSFLNLDSKDAAHMGKFPVYAFRRLSFGAMRSITADQVYCLNIKLTGSELREGYEVLRNLFNNRKPTIVLYTYATRNKIYSDTWWHEFYDKLKHRFPGKNFLEILPVENISQLSFSIKNFYSRDIREIASVIANSAVFIGADSGIMHLASSSGTPTVGLFKVTAIDSYTPYGNGSFAIDTTQVDMDRIVSSIEGIINDHQEIENFVTSNSNTP